MSQNIFDWEQQYETGLKQVDKQHYNLIETINSLFKLNLGSDSDKIRNKIIEDLKKYVVEHFHTEEEMMLTLGIDDRHVNKHKKLHEEFTAEVITLITKLETSTHMSLNDFGEYLVRWLAYHILSIDKSLARQIKFISEDNLTSEEAFEKDRNMYVASAEPLLKALRVLYDTVLDKNKQIEAYNLELEEIVQERTKELVQANKKLESITLTDTLTDLPNRRYALNEIKSALHLYKRYGNDYSVIFVDVDKFKPVNDTYGHEVGDEVLVWISRFLEDRIRETDVVCRLGGDEFLILLKETKTDSAINVAKKILLSLKEDYEISKYWNPSLSMGVSSIDKNTSNASDLIKSADEKMYEAKQKKVGIIT
jgi:hemerythrin